jgi:hypothetical protein
LDSDLSERYNAGLVPPPELAGAPSRLQYPAWRPTPAEVEAARRQVRLSLLGLALLGTACCLTLALLLGWMP